MANYPPCMETIGHMSLPPSSSSTFNETVYKQYQSLLTLLHAKESTLSILWKLHCSKRNDPKRFSNPSFHKLHSFYQTFLSRINLRCQQFSQNIQIHSILRQLLLNNAASKALLLQYYQQTICSPLQNAVYAPPSEHKNDMEAEARPSGASATSCLSKKKKQMIWKAFEHIHTGTAVLALAVSQSPASVISSDSKLVLLTEALLTLWKNSPLGWVPLDFIQRIESLWIRNRRIGSTVGEESRISTFLGVEESFEVLRNRFPQIEGNDVQIFVSRVDVEFYGDFYIGVIEGVSMHCPATGECIEIGSKLTLYHLIPQLHIVSVLPLPIRVKDVSVVCSKSTNGEAVYIVSIVGLTDETQPSLFAKKRWTHKCLVYTFNFSSTSDVPIIQLQLDQILQCNAYNQNSNCEFTALRCQGYPPHKSMPHLVSTPHMFAQIGVSAQCTICLHTILFIWSLSLKMNLDSPNMSVPIHIEKEFDCFILTYHSRLFLLPPSFITPKYIQFFTKQEATETFPVHPKLLIPIPLLKLSTNVWHICVVFLAPDGFFISSVYKTVHSTLPKAQCPVLVELKPIFQSPSAPGTNNKNPNNATDTSTYSESLLSPLVAHKRFILFKGFDSLDFQKSFHTLLLDMADSVVVKWNFSIADGLAKLNDTVCAAVKRTTPEGSTDAKHTVNLLERIAV